MALSLSTTTQLSSSRSESPSSSTSTALMGSPRAWVRKCERYCCLGATYLPLFFVYSITTWAVWVSASIGFAPTKSRYIGPATSLLSVALYVLLNWSYTTAVFTNPGSTIELAKDGYASLPTTAPPHATSFTVKSNGELRFCKKCNARKPDRAHHCSTCRRCVLKMDHHCPWLATCVGLRNYKAFLLFLSYTTLFCWVCFAVSGGWFWAEIISDGHYNDTLAPVNNIMLAVIAGIIALVLTAFTGWHIMLACRGQTTIECLEKTRYLSPLRKSMHQQHIRAHEHGQHRDDREDEQHLSFTQQLADIHTNALPGVLRPEEGEVHISSAATKGMPHPVSFNDRERQRSQTSYEAYLDEIDSEALPSAFDLGWKRNLVHLLGPRPALWFLPFCTTIGDGWAWEPSPKWLAAREQRASEREEQRTRELNAGWGGAHTGSANEAYRGNDVGRHYLSRPGGSQAQSKADRVLGRNPEQYADHVFDDENKHDGGRRPNSVVSMHTLRTAGTDAVNRGRGGLNKRDQEEDYDSSSDESDARTQLHDENLHPGYEGSGGISSINHNTSRRWREPNGLLGRVSSRSPVHATAQQEHRGLGMGSDAHVDEGVD